MATLVKGYPKATFSIATTPRCRGGYYSIPRIAPLYPWSSPNSAKQGSIRYHFLVFGMTWPGIEPRSPRSLVNTLLIRPILASWVECSLMAQETGVQSQFESYQRLKKWYLISPCLTLSIIRYVSRVKWSNPRKGVAPFPTPRCSSCWKRSL